MPRLPRTEQELVTWARQHADLWAGNGNPPAIGLTPEQVTTLELLVTDAEAALDAAQVARTATKSATQTKDTALDAMKTTLGGLLDTIDAFAKTSADPDVYARAGIDAPRPAAPRTDPPIPTDVAADLLNDGSVAFTFRAAAGGGAVFQIERQLTPIGETPGPWTTVATIGEKRFVDLTIPAGAQTIRYRARTQLTNGQRSQFSEDAAIYFGTAGTSGGPLAIAA